MRIELTRPRVSTQQRHRVPPVPTTSQLVATDHSSGFCLECCLHRTKRTVVVNTDRNTPAVWGAVSVTTRRHAVKKEQSNQKPPYEYQQSLRLPGLPDKVQYSYHVRGGLSVVPHEGYTALPTLQKPVTYVRHKHHNRVLLYCLINNPEKNMITAFVLDCAPVVGLRGPSCSRSSWPPHRLGTLGPLLRTWSRCHSIPDGSPSPPRPLPPQNGPCSLRY